MAVHTQEIAENVTNNQKKVQKYLSTDEMTITKQFKYREV